MKETSGRDSRWILAASYTAAVVVLMDMTAVNIALPGISNHFGISMDTVSWLLLISMLSSSSFALVAGRFIDLYEPRKLFIVGFSSFGLLTFLSFIVRDIYIIIAIRFVQGFAESLIYVIGPALIRKYLPVDRQQRAHGIWMMCTGIGISMGPVIGGLLVNVLDWYWVFLVNVPLILVGLLFALHIKKYMNAGSKLSAKSFDVPGAIYSFLFLAGLIYGLNTAGRNADISWDVLAAIFISGLSFYLFLKQEKQQPNPVFDFTLFHIRQFLLSNSGFFLFFLINVGSRFLRPFYFEEVKLFSSFTSGLLMMVSPIMMMFVSPIAKYLSDKSRPSLIFIGGNAFLAISMFMFTYWDKDTSLLFLILSMTVLGMGMGMFYPTSSYIGMSSLPEGKQGMGSAAISTSKSLGKLTGVLIFGMMFSFFLPKDLIVQVSAFQSTFLIAAILSVVALILSLGISRNTK